MLNEAVKNINVVENYCNISDSLLNHLLKNLNESLQTGQVLPILVIVAGNWF